MISSVRSQLTLEQLDGIHELASRYARYRLSAGGSASIIGGALCLAMFGLGLLLEADRRMMLAAGPVLWLLSKELLRRFYYQRSGGVAERFNAREKQLHRRLVIYLLVFSLGILGFALWKLGVTGVLSLPTPKLGYFLFILAMPVVVWRWLWSVSDYLVGLALLSQSAVLVASGSYPLNWLGILMACIGGASVVLGVREHRDFLRLRQELARNRELMRGVSE